MNVRKRVHTIIIVSRKQFTYEGTINRVIMKVIDFSNVTKALKVSRKMLSLAGIWPLEIRDILFTSFIIYGSIFVLLAILDLITYIKDFRYVLSNVMENMLVLMTMTKILMIRIKYRQLSRFLIETKEDYKIDTYKNDEEKLTFLKFNHVSHKFVYILCPWSSTLVLLYYFKSAIPNIIIAMSNSTAEYKLPYKIRPLVKPTNAKTYAFSCLHQFIRTIMIFAGYAGTDCFWACLGLHLTGQLAILKCKIKNFLNNEENPRLGIQKIILGHHRLIRLADILEDSFNIIIGQQLFGITIQLCISSYQMLVSFAIIEKQSIVTFVLYEGLLLATLITYCYVGDCIIEESTTLCEEFYSCNWYDLPIIDIKSICICMMRARKPLQITCAKFCILSMHAFTDIVNKSMAYLSFLRTAI